MLPAPPLSAAGPPGERRGKGRCWWGGHSQTRLGPCSPPPAKAPKDTARTQPLVSPVPCVSAEGAGCSGTRASEHARAKGKSLRFDLWCSEPPFPPPGRGDAPLGVPREQEVTMHRFIRQWCCTRSRDRSLCTFGKGWRQVPSTHAGGGQRQPTWPCRPLLAPGRPPLAHPRQPPHRRAQPCLLWAEPGVLAEAPDDSSPSSRTLPPSPVSQGPGSCPCVRSSARRQARAAGSWRTPLSTWRRGSPRCHPSRQTSAWESRTRGPAAAIPNGAGRAQRAAPGPPAWSPSSARQRSALRTGWIWVHPASSPAGGGWVL